MSSRAAARPPDPVARRQAFPRPFLWLAIVLAIAVATGLGALAQDEAASPFGQAPAAEEQATASPPGWFDRLLIEIRHRQRDLQRELAGAVRATGENPGFEALFALLGLCFLYGVFHAAGPGHGKAIITAYALTSERIALRAIGIAMLAAFVQATAAVLLVYAILLTLDGTTRLISESVTVAEAASFGLIAAMGLYLAVGGVRRLRRVWAMAASAGTGVPAHGDGRERAHDDGHDHGHDRAHGDEGGHAHAHDHAGHDHAHLPDAERLARMHGLRDAIAMALAVGIRPCTGAILVLVFAYGLGLHEIGILSSYAMGLGTGLTVAALVAVASLVRLPQQRAADRGRRWAQWADVALRIAGGVAILLLGALLFWATVTAPPDPFAG